MIGQNLVSIIRRVVRNDMTIDGEKYFFVGWTEHRDVAANLAIQWRNRGNKIRIKSGEIRMGYPKKKRTSVPIWYVYASRDRKVMGK